jgi:hypothetical protein
MRTKFVGKEIYVTYKHGEEVEDGENLEVVPCNGLCKKAFWASSGLRCQPRETTSDKTNLIMVRFHYSTEGFSKTNILILMKTFSN